MSEREMFLKSWDMEFQTTLKILKAFPADKQDLKPAEKSKSAKELAWTFVMEQAVMVDGIVKGQINFMNQQPMPATLPEIIAKFESEYPQYVAKVKAMSDADYNATMDFLVGPKQPGKVRRGDLLWMTLHDQIHHRGQFSVYLRIAGAKVPSIYGPTADEPWM